MDNIILIYVNYNLEEMHRIWNIIIMYRFYTIEYQLRFNFKPINKKNLYIFINVQVF